MKRLFMRLLLELKDYGDITEANMYKGGKFSYITLENEDGVYTVNITKEEKKDAN